jgi:hypothetical protein
MQSMAETYEEGPLSPNAMSLHFEAAFYADHILSYLGTWVDDIALAIVIATGLTLQRPIDSMGLLKDQHRNAALQPVESLLRELDNAGSWWESAFKRHVGGRQRLVHNQSSVQFQGSKAPGEAFETSAFLMAPLAQSPAINFSQLLRDIFASLFDWLDRLEVALLAHLLTTKGWSPQTNCPHLTLPVGYPRGLTTFAADYFIFPVCLGSDPLPWGIELREADDGAGSVLRRQ